MFKFLTKLLLSLIPLVAMSGVYAIKGLHKNEIVSERNKEDIKDMKTEIHNELIIIRSDIKKLLQRKGR